LHVRPQASSQPDPLGAILAGGRTVVLDGGLATELEAGGADLSDALWSARLLAEDPDAIARAHLAFFRAGAQVAITASYQASFEGFARRGIDAEAAAGLMRRSVEIAREAAAAAHRERDELDDGRPLLVAASVGPYGAFLADGSEYRGRYGLGAAALQEFHRRRMAVLLGAGPDLLAIETIPEIEEGEALATVLDELDGTGWLSFSCSDGARLRSGAPAEEAFAIADSARGVVAVGINCTAPEHVLELVERAAATTSKPIVVYPNSGEEWDPVRRHWSGARHPVDAAMAGGWIAAGARIVGGCCRVTPAQIDNIAASLRAVA
jgi:homocysteine S-methyltransferase